MGIDLIVMDTHPTIATKLALDITKTNEIVIKISKTDKVTVVVACLKDFRSKNSNSQKRYF